VQEDSTASGQQARAGSSSMATRTPLAAGRAQLPAGFGGDHALEKMRESPLPAPSPRRGSHQLLGEEVSFSLSVTSASPARRSPGRQAQGLSEDLEWDGQLGGGLQVLHGELESNPSWNVAIEPLLIARAVRG